jgi:hypothetical protein
MPRGTGDCLGMHGRLALVPSNSWSPDWIVRTGLTNADRGPGRREPMWMCYLEMIWTC